VVVVVAVRRGPRCGPLLVFVVVVEVTAWVVCGSIRRRWLEVVVVIGIRRRRRRGASTAPPRLAPPPPSGPSSSLLLLAPSSPRPLAPAPPPCLAPAPARPLSSRPPPHRLAHSPPHLSPLPRRFRFRLLVVLVAVVSSPRRRRVATHLRRFGGCFVLVARLSRPHPFGQGRGGCGCILAFEGAALSVEPTSLERGEGLVAKSFVGLKASGGGEGEGGDSGGMREDERKSTVMGLMSF
jgi:hypothetical protein